ncbi:hypothetical protein RESH_00378 [Rhodopirellula europaea SH398]|uniref:Uncharacterized protein n=2 Tax=Rhodopirellula europaea TaxID=1263866 RepID=M5SS01_9BACT|nr:hypothetical protein RE6C_02749 [Rhodopirellula europaea 6C]EMI29054.1 hypothetical protein RESH_00378 [Rhodopirellula europaea SH398]
MSTKQKIEISTNRKTSTDANSQVAKRCNSNRIAGSMRVGT